MKFFNREKEIKEILSIIKTEPKLIHFIFGPINSGKTALINEIIENRLDKKKYQVFYINFREIFISKYEDVIESFFETYEEPFSLKKKLKSFFSFLTDKLPEDIEVPEFILEKLGKFSHFSKIPIPKKLLKKLFSSKESKNIFDYIKRVFIKIREKGKVPIIIIDELQKIGDLKINGYFIYELFNFFISLTKERHLAHVFCLSSDSLFIEKIYNEGKLEGRAKYILVDDFDKKNALEFMDFYAKEVLKRKLLNEEKEKIYNLVGGKPIYITSIIDELLYKDLDEILNYFLQNEKQKIFMFLSLLDEEKVVIGDKTYIVKKNEIIKTLKDIAEKEVLSQKDILPKIYYFLVQKNILFLDPIKGILKPQSRLTYHAIKEALKELNLN